MHAGKQNRRRSSSGKRLCAAFSTVAIAATTVGLAPTTASASLTGNGVRAGSNITVFHNIDFVAVFGYGPVGQPVTVEVLRDGVLIGSASGPAIDAEGLPGLEVNHGPEGAAVDGDCWEGHTPDIRPGDVIHVTDGGGTDEVTVDNITFSGPATEEPPVAPAVDGDILVRGVAKFASGSNIPIDALDSGEFRDTSKFRGVPDEVEVDPLVDGGFIMRYHPPYELDRNENGLDLAQRKASLLNSGGHAIGFGHVDPLPLESMLVDGIADSPGPAPGCEAAPTAQNVVTSIGTANTGFLNAADLAGTGNITVGGLAFDANNVRVTVTDSVGGTLGPISASTSSPTGASTWSANIAKADLDGLDEGNLTISMVSETAGGDVPGADMTLTKDTLAPAAPTADPAAGPHIGVQHVELFAGPGDDIFFSQGATPSAPTTPYTPGSTITIASDQTLQAIAVDDAENPSALFSGVYDITPQTAPGAPIPGATRTGDRNATLAWSAPTSNGFSEITSYKVTADAPGSVLDKSMTVLGDARAATVGGLENGTSYQLRVAAINAFGESTPSAPRAVTPATVPDAPEIGFARAGRGTASVTWLAPEDDNGADVTSYRLRVYRGPSLVRNLNMGLARRASLTGLAYGANYRFAVEARNIMGYSAQSARSNAVVPRSIPSKPRRVRGQSGTFGGRDTARVTWLVPATIRGSRITTYVVRAQRVRANGSLGPARVVAVKPPRARSANLALRSGTYRLKVRAINGIGRSPWSNLSNRAQSR